MPNQLDAKIYSLTFKLLFTSGVGDKLAASSLPSIELAASNWAIFLEWESIQYNICLLSA